MTNRSQLRESLQYLEYVSEVIGGLKDVDMSSAQENLGIAIGKVKEAYRKSDKDHNEAFRHRREMSEVSANLEMKYRSQKRMTDSAKVAVAVAKEQLAAAMKSSNEAEIQAAKDKLTATITRRVTAEQHEAAAKRNVEQGEF